MLRKHLRLLCLLSLLTCQVHAQSFYTHTKAADKWVKKQFRKLSKDQRIAQLMIIRAHSNLGPEHVAQVKELISKYRVGGLCFFQGGPVRQALLTNAYQSLSAVPLMVSIDAEWGLGMRLDSVTSFPRQLMIGATQDAGLVYRFGKAVGEQCKRIGVQVNYAPVVDVNNNPLNPVINDRSFGEDKYKVALYGTEYMKGMQDIGVMATAKHFPGHGDVTVDSHKDLPEIDKTRAQLDSLELYPFKQLIDAGVGSIMTAHLFIPAIDTTAHLPSSLSYKNVTGILRNDLGFQGISFTDALEMQGVAKYFPKGDASVLSLIAGNDMLCLPGDIPGSIAKVKQAIKEGKLSWNDINTKVKKVLLAKYHLGLADWHPVDTTNLVSDLNASTDAIRFEISKDAITLLKQENPALLPLRKTEKIAYICLGAPGENAITARLKADYNADIFFLDSQAEIGKQVMDDKSPDAQSRQLRKQDARQLLQTLQEKNYDVIIVGLHNYSRRPANHYGIAPSTQEFLDALQGNKTITLVFGNPYAIAQIKGAANLVACYEDDALTQSAAADLLAGRIQPRGTLPVSVNDSLPFGTGIQYNSYFPKADPASVGVNTEKLNTSIDAIAEEAVSKGATPGCVVLVARDGKLIYHKAFGYTDFDKKEPVKPNMVYDLASVTKVSATTVSIMKLYEEGKIDLDKTLGDYLPWVQGSNKAGLKLTDILLHQAGLVPFIPFYREVIDSTTGKPLPQYFSAVKDAQHEVKVAENLYLRNDWEDTLKQRILQSKLGVQGKYVYSDNDFIFLGKIVEAVSGKPLNEFVRDNFYRPLHMSSTTFRPLEVMPVDRIAPTELETHFRMQFLRGNVHDEGSAMFGGVAGHAGLFSDAYDLAQLYQMLLNGGELNGIRLLKPETIQKFTAYNSAVSRRGLGFDKPEKDNDKRKDPYPSKFASPETFGHTGFTGTCVWVDPKSKLVYIFLSNRVTPTRNNNKLSQLNIRSRIQDAIYEAIER
ncbi:MAG TPA: glycoside hydrolase family 3 N-terminal domain-containing protein [Sediminibacterium sp.]|nr:glycoside hydrolase family 3 N-terminal domain-containing protein [Sediminibacterium sp.]